MNDIRRLVESGVGTLFFVSNRIGTIGKKVDLIYRHKIWSDWANPWVAYHCIANLIFSLLDCHVDLSSDWFSSNQRLQWIFWLSDKLGRYFEFILSDLFNGIDSFNIQQLWQTRRKSSLVLLHITVTTRTCNDSSYSDNSS